MIFNGGNTIGTAASLLTMTGASGSFAVMSTSRTTAGVVSNVAPVLGQSDVQTLSFSGTLSGFFGLTVNGQSTAPIQIASDAFAGTNAQAQWIPLADNIQAALNNMLGVGNTRVLSSPGSGASTPIITIQFTGTLAGADIPQIATNSPAGGVTIAVATALDGAGNSVQTLTGTSGGTVTPQFNGFSSTIPLTFSTGTNAVVTMNETGSGNFTITYTPPSQATQLRPGRLRPGRALTAAQVQAHLNTIPALAGNVIVGGAQPNFTFTFVNALAQQAVGTFAKTGTGRHRRLYQHGGGNGGLAHGRSGAIQLEHDSGLGRQCVGHRPERRTVHDRVRQRPVGRADRLVHGCDDRHGHGQLRDDEVRPRSRTTRSRS